MPRCWIVPLILFVVLPLQAQEARTNRWVPLGDPAFELPKTGWPDLVGSGLVWIDDLDLGLVAPSFSAEPYGFRTVAGSDPKWKFHPGQGPDKRLPDRWESPRGYVYLPTLKKVLFLKQEWSYSSNKQPAAGWLLDPATGQWQPIDDPLSMSDRSADFGITAGRDGLRLPIWGALAYDALNQEAVAFGGGGTWGRVGQEKEAVKPGDWIVAEPDKRVRRLGPADAGITSACRWFPGHCGTWTFSPATLKWAPTAQPLSQQPSARILPGMAYHADAGKIVLFGGDDLARCLGDTWIYDCKTRVWSQVQPKQSPPARAGHALVSIPGQGVLLAGGYGGGWKPLADVWIYSLPQNEWSRLDLDLPQPAAHASAIYDAKRQHVVLASYAGARGNKQLPLHSLRLDLAAVRRRDAVALDPVLDYHCKAKRAPSDLPDEWLAGAAAPDDPKQTLAALQALPANRWKKLAFPKNAPERNWGSYIYDPKTHVAYAWGGGHSAYPGAEVSEFDLLGNRWRGMADATNYNPVWLHGMVGGPPGVSFGGWSLLPTHARKSYGVDPLSGMVVTYVGDLYDPKQHRFIANIGQAPGKYGVATQVAFVTAPHGLYGYSTGTLVRANVKAGGWDTVANGGPPDHEEHNHLCYDAKRDRLIYFTRAARVWAFDFKSKSWAEETPAGKAPPKALGDSTYVPELDAALLIFAEEKGQPEKLWLYKLAEKKWYTAPSEGDPFAGANLSGRDWSPHYDPTLKLLVRVTPTAFAQWLSVHVLRLDPGSLKLTAVE